MPLCYCRTHLGIESRNNEHILGHRSSSVPHHDGLPCSPDIEPEKSHGQRHVICTRVNPILEADVEVSNRVLENGVWRDVLQRVEMRNGVPIE